jgi:hypothetical protein
MKTTIRPSRLRNVTRKTILRDHSVTFNVGGFAFDVTVMASSDEMAVKKGVRLVNRNIDKLKDVSMPLPFHTYGRITVLRITAGMVVEVYSEAGGFFRP